MTQKKINVADKEIHQPVLLREVIDYLAIQADGIYVDGTYGRGGHSKAILAHLGPKGRLIALDKDPDALRSVTFTDERFTIEQGSFARMEAIIKEKNIVGRVNGILLDLGVSSPQLNKAERGFSFMREGPLDMRMDNTQGITAAQWLNQASHHDIMQVLRDFGEERYAKRIATAIVKARQTQPFTSTMQLSQIIADAHPAWEKGQHPATRCFQGIRIFINNELAELKIALEQALRILAPGGRLCVISFHSLEDRIVKQFLQKYEKGDEFPRGVPIKQDQLKPRLRRIGRAIRPSQKELASNYRARSATLRVGEKL